MMYASRQRPEGVTVRLNTCHPPIYYHDHIDDDDDDDDHDDVHDDVHDDDYDNDNYLSDRIPVTLPSIIMII